MRYIFGIYIIEFRSIKISMFPCDYVARCLDRNCNDFLKKPRHHLFE